MLCVRSRVHRGDPGSRPGTVGVEVIAEITFELAVGQMQFAPTYRCHRPMKNKNPPVIISALLLALELKYTWPNMKGRDITTKSTRP